MQKAKTTKKSAKAKTKLIQQLCRIHTYTDNNSGLQQGFPPSNKIPACFYFLISYCFTL